MSKRKIFAFPFGIGPTALSANNFKRIIQSEHKVFPWLQAFIARKLRGMQTYFFFKILLNSRSFLQHISTLQLVLLLYST